MTKDFISDRVNFAPLNKKTEKNEESYNSFISNYNFN